MQIEVSHLVKEYKRKKSPGSMAKALAGMFHPQYEIFRAVDDVNFGIEKGEAVGYIGPNGSGKSTTIKMLSGVLTPTGGRVLVNGMEPAKNRMKVNKKYQKMKEACRADAPQNECREYTDRNSFKKKKEKKFPHSFPKECKYKRHRPQKLNHDITLLNPLGKLLIDSTGKLRR